MIEELEYVQAYVGLGGNLGHPLETLQKAFYLIGQLPQVKACQLSRWYCSSPVGDLNQPDFINAVCRFETTLKIKELFAEIQQIEKSLGKVDKPKYAARPIDIDLLFYGGESYHDHELIVPHVSWSQRLFVLIPLADLTPTIFLGSEVINILELIKQFSYVSDQKIWPLTDVRPSDDK